MGVDAMIAIRGEFPEAHGRKQVPSAHSPTSRPVNILSYAMLLTRPHLCSISVFKRLQWPYACALRLGFAAGSAVVRTGHGSKPEEHGCDGG
jgi:hypothetical protein